MRETDREAVVAEFIRIKAFCRPKARSAQLTEPRWKIMRSRATSCAGRKPLLACDHCGRLVSPTKAIRLYRVCMISGRS